MKRKKIIGLGIVALLGGVVVGGLAMPRSFTVERRAVVKAPLEQVYAAAADLARHPSWSARKAREPGMTFSFPVAVKAGLGAVYEWRSTDHGNGRCEITAAEKNRRLEMHVTMEGKGGGVARWAFSASPGGTEVMRSFEAEIPVPVLGSWILLLMRPEERLGRDFDEELRRFAGLLEGSGAT